MYTKENINSDRNLEKRGQTLIPQLNNCRQEVIGQSLQ